MIRTKACSKDYRHLQNACDCSGKHLSENQAIRIYACHKDLNGTVAFLCCNCNCDHLSVEKNQEVKNKYKNVCVHIVFRAVLSKNFRCYTDLHVFQRFDFLF